MCFYKSVDHEKFPHKNSRLLNAKNTALPTQTDWHGILKNKCNFKVH